MQKLLQFVANICLLSAIGLAQTTGKVTVSSPVSGSTVASPVHFVAWAQAPANRHITAMRIYIDYKSVYTVNSSSLNTYVSMTQGSHKATVQAWDNSGSVFKKWLSLTVVGPTPSPTPTPTPSPTPTPTPSPSPTPTPSPSPTPSPTPTPTPTPSPTPTPTTGGFYVSPTGNDANSGTASAPWATLQHAANMVKPGSVVHVAPGTYGAINTSVSGTASAPIRFISDTKWGAKIRTTGVSDMWYNTANYVDIVGFDISGDGMIGILNMGSFVRIIGNHIHNIPAACNSNAGAGIDNANYNASDDDVIGNLVHDIGADFSVKCGTVQGIYHANLRGHIMNNIVYRAWAYGIHLYHVPKDVVVANNLVFQSGEAGIYVGASSGSLATGITVVNNIIRNNPMSTWGGGQAIIEGNAGAGTNRYINNLIWSNKSGIVLNGNTDVGTINADPLMINYQSNGSGDYHLQSGSRAINSATTTNAPAMDFDGAARPFGSGPDIGIYEFGATPAGWPWM